MNEEDIRGLIDPRNFINAWFNALPNFPTYEAAYESIEEVYENYFKRRKYSDYNSFRNVKGRITKTSKSR
jgi:hypothetical protein